MMMQGSPQSQSVRSDRQFPAPSDQGRLPIGALEGNPTQSTDRDRFPGLKRQVQILLFPMSRPFDIESRKLSD
jgi:hypothetical protein